MKYDSEYGRDDFDRNWIPKSLIQFLSMFKLSYLRQESIGQCIWNEISQKIIPLILLTLGVRLDYIYGSKWLIDELFIIGFTLSYTEVMKYKQAEYQMINKQNHCARKVSSLSLLLMTQIIIYESLTEKELFME